MLASIGQIASQHGQWPERPIGFDVGYEQLLHCDKVEFAVLDRDPVGLGSGRHDQRSSIGLPVFDLVLEHQHVAFFPATDIDGAAVRYGDNARIPEARGEDVDLETCRSTQSGDAFVSGLNLVGFEDTDGILDISTVTLLASSRQCGTQSYNSGSQNTDNFSFSGALRTVGRLISSARISSHSPAADHFGVETMLSEPCACSALQRGPQLLLTPLAEAGWRSICCVALRGVVHAPVLGAVHVNIALRERLARASPQELLLERIPRDLLIAHRATSDLRHRRGRRQATGRRDLDRPGRGACPRP